MGRMQMVVFEKSPRTKRNKDARYCHLARLRSKPSQESVARRTNRTERTFLRSLIHATDSRLTGWRAKTSDAQERSWHGQFF